MTPMYIHAYIYTQWAGWFGGRGSRGGGGYMAGSGDGGNGSNGGNGTSANTKAGRSREGDCCSPDKNARKGNIIILEVPLSPGAKFH